MKKCLNCGYERQSEDESGFTPASECPKCHAIYEKVEKWLIEQEQKKEKKSEEAIVKSQDDLANSKKEHEKEKKHEEPVIISQNDAANSEQEQKILAEYQRYCEAMKERHTIKSYEEYKQSFINRSQKKKNAEFVPILTIFLRILAFLSLMAGIILCAKSWQDGYELNTLSLVWLISGIVEAVVSLTFGEILLYLDKIEMNTRKK